jgi:hypothetical protein
MAKTALQLVRELGHRFGEYCPVTVSGTGTTTTIVAADAAAYFPGDIDNFHAWFYGPSALTDTSNRTLERRARSWNASTTTFTFATGSAWGQTVDAVGDVYDVHTKYPYSRLLQAINDGVGMLGMSWWRPVIDTTILTVANTWRYLLPAATPWHAIEAILIQTNLDQSSFPYADASAYGAEIEHNVTTAGVDQWYLQFRDQPPPGRAIKIMGQAGYTALATDADVLPIGGENEAVIVHWLMGWGKYCIQDWDSDAAPSSEVEGHRQRAADQLIKAREDIIALGKPTRNSRILTPMNRGRAGSGGGEPHYLAAFTPH